MNLPGHQREEEEGKHLGNRQKLLHFSDGFIVETNGIFGDHAKLVQDVTNVERCPVADCRVVVISPNEEFKLLAKGLQSSTFDMAKQKDVFKIEGGYIVLKGFGS